MSPSRNPRRFVPPIHPTTLNIHFPSILRGLPSMLPLFAPPISFHGFPTNSSIKVKALNLEIRHGTASGTKISRLSRVYALENQAVRGTLALFHSDVQRKGREGKKIGIKMSPGGTCRRIFAVRSSHDWLEERMEGKLRE